MFSLMMITVSFHDVMARNLSLFPVICVLTVWLPIKEINLKTLDQGCSNISKKKNCSIRLQNIPEKGNTPVKYFRKQDFYYWPSTSSANHQLSRWN